MTADPPSTARSLAERAARRTDAALGLLAAALVFAMMALTAVDVAARYLFNAPLTGAFELTELMLAALVFAGLPLATRGREHVDVDLLFGLLPPGLKRANLIAVDAAAAAILVVLAVRLFDEARDLAADGTVTNSLAVPVAPVGFLMVVTTLLAAAILAGRAVALIRRPGGGRAGGDGP